MLPHSLPCRGSRGSATLPHRLPLRSIPPQRFACGSSHSRGHGRPRSVRKSSRLRWKCLSMDCRCSDIANLSAHLHRLPTPPAYLRRMRLSPGRGRCLMANDVAAPLGYSTGCCRKQSAIRCCRKRSAANCRRCEEAACDRTVGNALLGTHPGERAARERTARNATRGTHHMGTHCAENIIRRL